jgi:hypothetical protein
LELLGGREASASGSKTVDDVDVGLPHREQSWHLACDEAKRDASAVDGREASASGSWRHVCAVDGRDASAWFHTKFGRP